MTTPGHVRSYRAAMTADSSPRGVFAAWFERLVGPVLAVWLVVETIRIEGVDQPLGALLGAWTGLALVVRRRLSVACYVAGMGGLMGLSFLEPAFGDSSAAFIVLFFVLTYSLGRWSRGSELWAGLACVVAGAVAFVIGELNRSDGPRELSADSVVFAFAYCMGPWLAGLVIGALVNRNIRLREEQADIAERAVIEERARIARELHDVVSHAISVTVLQARGARRSLDDDPVAAREALEAIEQTNAQALGDMRRLLAVLRDTEADTTTAPQPSLARVDELIGPVRDSGAPVTLVIEGEGRDVPPGVDLSAYRIVQEALTNVLRHAPGAPTSVTLEYGAAELVVSVTNAAPSGRGPMPGTGNGLVGIHERVAVVGGEVHVGATDDGGFGVRARLPYALEMS